MGSSRGDRLRQKYAEYHQTNPNKRPLGTMIDGRFVHLQDAPEEAEVAAEISARFEAEERTRQLWSVELGGGYDALGGGE